MAKKEQWRLDIEMPVNGQYRKATVAVLDQQGTELTRDKANLDSGEDRRRLARRILKCLQGEQGLTEKAISDFDRALSDQWVKVVTARRETLRSEQQAAAEEARQAQEEDQARSHPWRGKVPAGYWIDLTGCVREGSPGDSDRTLTRGPLHVEAFTRDYQSGGWGALIAWRDRDGQPHELAVPAGRFHEQSGGLIEELANGGLAIVPGCERHVLRYLAAANTSDRFVSVSRLGWIETPGAPVYVWPGRIIGTTQERYVYQPERHSPTTLTMRTAGTLEEWRDNVASLATGNPMLVFCLSVSFAAPLLKFAALEGGGFHLFSPSSRGKTTALQLAASVWGCGADPAEALEMAFVRKWNATANAIEAIAAAHNDGLLALDEIGEAQVRDFGRLVYQLAGGQGKTRLSRDANLCQSRTWRVLTLSTGEAPAQAVIEAEGTRAKGGQLVRMVDVPATAADGGLVHNALGMQAAAFIGCLKRACATFYGTAGPEFVRALCQDGDTATLAAKVQEHLDEAHLRLLPEKASEEVARVVRRFALVEVAGRLASAAGIIPQSAEQVQAAAQLALERWLSEHGKGGEIDRALEQLREFILRNSARFRDRTVETQFVRDLVGYRDQVAGLFLLTPQGMREALAGHSVLQVARELKKRGWLYQNDNHLCSRHQVAGIASRPRFYAVKDSYLGEDDDGD